jgi:hypothetical protein
MRALFVAGLLAITALPVVYGANTTHDLEVLKHDYYLLESHRLIYSPDIFDYCSSTQARYFLRTGEYRD